MLRSLSIQNIVLIESANVPFAAGLCVLSGETGAGKSILLDALGLVLGSRAGAGLIRSGATSGVVTAEWDISENERVRAALSALELPVEETLIVRRSIDAEGKTRCFINDQPVTVAALKTIGETLVEMHGQHDQRLLNDAVLHRSILDEYGVPEKTLASVRVAFEGLSRVRKELAALDEQMAQAQRERDYLEHMSRELSVLKPEAGEEELLAERRAAMMGGEKNREVLNDAMQELNAGKHGVVAALRGAQRVLHRSTLSADASVGSIIEALERAAIEAEEATDALEKIGQNLQFRPSDLEEVEERLFALRAASRKYQLPVDELSALYQDVARKLSLLATSESQRGALEEQMRAAMQQFSAAAAALTEARSKAASKLERSITKELEPLKMAGTRFRVRLEPLSEAQWSAMGADLVQFECATNVGSKETNIAFAPLSKIASGGELSRFMLALKVALAAVRHAPVMIFDEIDTGTGGAVADAIGKRLALLAESAQVLVVTHLPQVAARGGHHLLVAKATKGGKVSTTVTVLDVAAREEELARMLAGEIITPEARKAAQKLLEHAA